MSRMPTNLDERTRTEVDGAVFLEGTPTERAAAAQKAAEGSQMSWSDLFDLLASRA